MVLAAELKDNATNLCHEFLANTIVIKAEEIRVVISLAIPIFILFPILIVILRLSLPAILSLYSVPDLLLLLGARPCCLGGPVIRKILIS